MTLLRIDHADMESLLYKNYGRAFLMASLLFLTLLMGCSSRTSALAEKLTTQRVEMPQQCIGWEKITLKNSSRYALLQQDQRLVVNIDAHNLRGRNLGCWQ